MPALGECDEWLATGLSVFMEVYVSHRGNFK